MSKSPHSIFKISLVAASIASLSACSSSPNKPPVLDSIGSGIVKAGKATANATRKTWNTTTYLLGFSDSRDGSSSEDTSEEQLLVVETDVNQVRPIEKELPLELTPAIKLGEVADSDFEGGPTLVEEATASIEPADTPVDDTAVELTLTDKNPAEYDSEGLVHVVGPQDTLWSIAKTTTGDANNWHLLADANNLEQSATVYPDQELIIPADLVKQNYESPVTSDALAVNEADEDAAAESRAVNAASVDLAADSLAASEASVDSAADSLAASEASVDFAADSLAASEASVDSAADTLAASEASVDSAADTLALNDASIDYTTEDPDAPEIAAAFVSTGEPAIDVSVAATPFDLQNSETLWDFAKRTTGDATNWQAIADHNNFTEKQAVTVRPGQTIYVPQAMVRDGLGADLPSAETADSLAINATESGEELVETTAAEADTVVTDAATTASAASADIASDISTVAAAALPLETEAPENAEETPDIRIVEATYKTDDSLNPVAADEESVTIVENANIPEQIMVSGTYYPKAIYNDADFSASLLMRVSPGTTLQVSKAMGTWYEVETDKGVGYVHQRDIQ